MRARDVLRHRRAGRAPSRLLRRDRRRGSLGRTARLPPPPAAADDGRCSSRDDLARGSAAIDEATGQQPLWHRPPYGIYSSAGLTAARAAGLRPLLWSRWGKDWRKLHDPSADRRAGAARSVAGGCDPAARRGLLQRRQARTNAPPRHSELMLGELQRRENRYRPACLTALAERTHWQDWHAPRGRRPAICAEHAVIRGLAAAPTYDNRTSLPTRPSLTTHVSRSASTSATALACTS